MILQGEATSEHYSNIQRNEIKEVVSCSSAYYPDKLFLCRQSRNFVIFCALLLFNHIASKIVSEVIKVCIYNLLEYVQLLDVRAWSIIF